MTTTPQIIIKRKGGNAGRAYGGAWKVAYADFVTALMALFIVLWLSTSPDEVQKAVACYFRDPRGSNQKLESSYRGTGGSVILDRKLTILKEKLQLAIREIPNFDKLKGNIQMTVTGEGLRIELIEDEKGMFFESGQAKPTQAAKGLLIELARQLGRMENRVVIEGHTDAVPFNGPGSYTNWELSADRANAARKTMQENGLKANQVIEVGGFADRRLRLADRPEDPSNRRISIIVSYAHTLGPSR